MKERPILFSGPMVRAILDGRKTQTRRVVKTPKDCYADSIHDAYDIMINEDREAAFLCAGDQGWNYVKSPYGVPGDRLWVRETWCPIHEEYETGHCEPLDKPAGIKWTEWFCMDTPSFISYRASTSGNALWKWIPAIHMPKCVSRITLEVTDVRVERLRSISVADAVAEGLESKTSIGPFRTFGWKDYTKGSDAYLLDARESFQSLWDSINGEPRKDGVDISWSANPWVWVVEFRRVD